MNLILYHLYLAISEENQLVFLIIGIAVLFILVFWNNSRNKKQQSARRTKSFRNNYTQKKQDLYKSQDENIHKNGR